jgi:glycosyltransferase involved in cell wall biosynthesis
MIFYEFPTKPVSENSQSNSNQVKLDLQPITDDELPTVSIVTITHNRADFVDLMIRNYKAIDYPRNKLEWIVVDDTQYSPGTSRYTDKLKPYARVIQLKDKLPLGKKRNFVNCLAKNDYIVHMDDDDFYPGYSVVARIRVLLAYEALRGISSGASKNNTGFAGCVGCSKVSCYDLITCESFEAFDADPETKNPCTISESTFAYSKKFWSENKFCNEDTFAECKSFVGSREVCTIPSSFVITQFTHSTNTIVRRLNQTVPMLDTDYDFLKTISAADYNLIQDIRAKIIMKIPEYTVPLEFVRKIIMLQNSRTDSKTINKKIQEAFDELEREASIDVLRNPLVLEMRYKYLRRNETKTVMKISQESSRKKIVYYCGPGKILKHSNPWSPTSKTLGGSEEAVINLCREFAREGHDVTVYCLLEKEPTLLTRDSLVFDGVHYVPYWLWNPLDHVDTLIIWRDPTIIDAVKPSCKNLFLDMHDALEVSAASAAKFHKIFVKSQYHKKYIKYNDDRTGDRVIAVANGIYTEKYRCNDSEIDAKDPDMAFCSSSPDRCLTGLLAMLPLIREKRPNFKIYWAYGFNAGVNKGGIAEDPRPEVRDYYQKCLEMIKAAGDGFVNLNRLSQDEIIEYYKKSKYMIYGTRFPEIDCISLSKALCAGCVPLVVGPAALQEKMTKLGLEAPDVTYALGLDKALVDGPEFDYWFRMILDNIVTDEKSVDGHSEIIAEFDIRNVAKRWLSSMA